MQDGSVAPPTVRRSALLAIFFLSGAAALVYEVLWLKELGLLFGVTAYATATTLAVFFLGLSAGSLTWGRRAARVRRPLRTYAWLELGIAVTALLYFALLGVYHWAYPGVFAVVGDNHGLMLTVKFLLSAGILFLPAFLMGGTLPVMGQYLIRNASELGRTATVLYAVNTFGAAVGALAAGFYLPAAFGFRRSYLMAIATSLSVAAIAGWWSRAEAPVSAEVRVAETDGAGRAPRLLWLLAFASGFLTLALEVLWTRMFSQVLQNSVYTFAIILTVFLIALALGSVVAYGLCRRETSPDTTVVVLLTVSGFLVGVTPLVFYRLTGGLEIVGRDLGFTRYVAAVFGTTALVLLVPGILIGSVFPYLMKLAERHTSSAGKTIGQLVSVNTLAAILGSLAAGFLLLDWLGLWASLRAISLGYLALALGVTIAIGPSRRWLHAAVAAAGLVLFGWFVTYANFAEVSRDSRSETIVGLWEGAHGTVAVLERDGDLRLKVNNSYLLGTSKAAVNYRLQTWIALALHPDPKSVFFLGMGTGVTAGAALDLPVEHVTVCELNPDVIEASRAHYGPHVNGLYEDPRAEVIAEDGRNFLAGTDRKFDVIIGDIFLTYRAGVGALYTVEHFRQVRERLEKDGVFVQWLTLFDLSPHEMGILARTMTDVFPQVTLWRRSVSPTFPVYALVGQVDTRPLDLTSFERTLAALEESGALPESVWIGNIPLAAYAGNLSVIEPLLAEYPLSTDDRRPLEYLAPRTERDSKGANTATVLTWQPLASFCRWLLEQSPTADDPFLALVAPETRAQIDAGLAYYEYEAYRRLGSDLEARDALARYRTHLARAGVLTSGGSSP